MVQRDAVTMRNKSWWVSIGQCVESEESEERVDIRNPDVSLLASASRVRREWCSGAVTVRTPDLSLLTSAGWGTRERKGEKRLLVLQLEGERAGRRGPGCQAAISVDVPLERVQGHVVWE